MFYRQAVEANELRVLGRPSADVVEWPNEKDFSGDLLVEVEVDVRPEFELPAFEGTTVEVDAVEVDEAAIDEELDRLRARFGTLVTVDRPAATGDFVELDLVATIDGAEIDRAEGVSYEVGSGELLEGIDEAIDSLTAGEDTTFRSTLVGGDHAGEEAEVAVTVKAVKERELPEADDDFAQIASEFDTIAELRDSLKERVGQQSVFTQGSAARDKLIEQLLEQVEIPVPPQLIEDEVHTHLEGEGRLEDDVHRAEVTEASEKQFKTQMLLDAIAEKRQRLGLAGRAHAVPRAVRRAVRHAAPGVRERPPGEQPAPRHRRRGRAQQGPRRRARQGHRRRHQRQPRRPDRLRRRRGRGRG